MTPLRLLLRVGASLGVRVEIAEFLNSDLVTVSEWYDLLEMKSNANEIKGMLLQSPSLTIGETVLKETDDLDILGVTFDSKMTFEIILAQYTE